MKYSIIIPTLNEEKLLPDLLKQLSNPEFKNKYDYEIIVSDGGSTDNTIEIARKYSDIVKVHSDEKRQNIAAGRNIGADSANTDIFIFFNGDIIIPDIDYFFNFVENKFLNSNYLAMTCMVKVFPEEEILADKIFQAVYNMYFRFLNFIGVGMGRGECQVIRKEIFYRFKGYNEELAAGEDFDLYKRIRKEGKILFSKDLFIFESPRRFRKLGYKNVSWVWIKNGLSVFFKGKAISKEWEQIR
ncbi:MAG: glycosyltransferase [Ignavibacteriaceae bacterium]